MTPDEQRIAIAEVCGWVWVADEGEWCHPREVADSCGMPPNYRGDLNAMHEAEKLLTDDQWQDYIELLMNKTLRWSSYRNCAHAPAAMRAEAFCRTLYPERFQ